MEPGLDPRGTPDSPPEQEILPFVLGTSSDCDASGASSLNDHSSLGPLAIAAIGYECTSGYNEPLVWTPNSGMLRIDVPAPCTSGTTNGVSDDGVIVGVCTGSGDVMRAFERAPASPPEGLPMLPGSIWSGAGSVDSTGSLAAGFNDFGDTDELVRWRRASGSWTVEGVAVGHYSWPAIDDAGMLVAGKDPNDPGLGQAWIFRSEEAGYALPGTSTRPYDVLADGTVVAGTQFRPCPSGTCALYPVPVYWQLEANQSWTLHDLPSLDDVDGRALGVARVDGQLVLVGSGFTKSDGIPRAVAWLPQPDGSYGPPLRLGAVDGKSKLYAKAVAVNRHGLAVGIAEVAPFKSSAVLWTLPRPLHLFSDDFERGDACQWSARLGDADCP